MRTGLSDDVIREFVILNKNNNNLNMKIIIVAARLLPGPALHTAKYFLTTKSILINSWLTAGHPPPLPHILSRGGWWGSQLTPTLSVPPGKYTEWVVAAALKEHSHFSQGYFDNLLYK